MNTGQQKQKRKDEPIKYRDDLIHRRKVFCGRNTPLSFIHLLFEPSAPDRVVG